MAIPERILDRMANMEIALHDLMGQLVESRKATRKAMKDLGLLTADFYKLTQHIEELSGDKEGA